MNGRPPYYKRTESRFPSTTLFRSGLRRCSRRTRSRSCAACSQGLWGEQTHPSWIIHRSRPRPAPPPRLPRAVYRMGGGVGERAGAAPNGRSEEHTSELQSLMRISYAVFCLKKKKKKETTVSD